MNILKTNLLFFFSTNMSKEDNLNRMYECVITEFQETDKRNISLRLVDLFFFLFIFSSFIFHHLLRHYGNTNTKTRTLKTHHLYGQTNI